MATRLTQEEENYVRMSLLLMGISPRAARALFDQEFAPSCLNATITKEYNKLKDLQKKRVINQRQWNLLFPGRPDVPDSKTFDVTLMITLLRNLTNLSSPCGGYDQLPSDNETSPTSDLARIKYYRNIMAHLDEGKIDNSTFNTTFTTAWDIITNAIGRLGGQTMKDECYNLKVKILDQTNQEIIMDIKRSKDEMSELKKSVKSLNNSMKSLNKTKKAMKVEVKRLKASNEVLTVEVKRLKKANTDTVPSNIRGMATKCFRDLQLQIIHSQQEIKNLHSALTYMFQENRNRDARFRAEKLKTIFFKLKKKKDSALKELNGFADNLDLLFITIKRSQIAGSSAAMSGCVLVIVGLALIPVSFGTSSILSIVGTAISGAGGMTTGGSTIVDTVLSSKKMDDVKKILNEYNTTMDEVKEECIEIGKILNNSSNDMATEYNTWCSFWSKFALGVTATSAGSWSAIANPIINSLRLASVGEDVAAAGFRGISVAGRAFTFAGGVDGILLLPLDIYTLVDYVHKKNQHKVSIKIRKICSKINADFPTDEEIQHMIHDTFSRRPILVREAYNQIVM